MQPNAILVVSFLKDEYSFPVVWNEHGVYSSENEVEDITERIFLSDEFETEWNDGRPKLEVMLMGCPEVSSNAYYSEDSGEIYSNISLNHFLQFQKQ